jgi:hypothetical protein
VKIELAAIDPEGYDAHPLHRGGGIWNETNCYADFWIEVLHAFGFDPVAAFGCTLSSDFEGDQWTMFKFASEDLRELFGLRTNELNVWRPLDEHVAEQLSMGRLLTIDVDAWFLPDTKGITYRAEHQKTTLAVQMIDPEARRLGYFHNAGYFELSGDDFDGVLGIGDHARADVLPPYVEAVYFDGRQDRGGAELVSVARSLASSHVRRAPRTNPLTRMKKRVQADVEWLAHCDLATFHRYAFGTCRQCGANAELAAAFVEWLDQRDGGGLAGVVDDLLVIANGCKALQFSLARVARGRRVDIEDAFGKMEDSWDAAMGVLVRLYG